MGSVQPPNRSCPNKRRFRNAGSVLLEGKPANCCVRLDQTHRGTSALTLPATGTSAPSLPTLLAAPPPAAPPPAAPLAPWTGPARFPDLTTCSCSFPPGRTAPARGEHPGAHSEPERLARRPRAWPEVQACGPPGRAAPADLRSGGAGPWGETPRGAEAHPPREGAGDTWPRVFSRFAG